MRCLCHWFKMIDERIGVQLHVIAKSGSRIRREGGGNRPSMMDVKRPYDSRQGEIQK